MIEFVAFPKIPRLRRECIITEKIDGTNAQIHIWPDAPGNPRAIAYNHTEEHGELVMLAGSRTRWITPEDDNFGFAAWVRDHAEELLTLGPGQHFGEWWGRGIQRGYGLEERRFSLFNTARWNPLNPNKPACCHVVPVLYTGPLGNADQVVADLAAGGSVAAPGFMKPEGVVVYHAASKQLFKTTCEHDDEPKNAHVKKDRLPRAPKVRDPNIGGRRIKNFGPLFGGHERRVPR